MRSGTVVLTVMQGAVAGVLLAFAASATAQQVQVVRSTGGPAWGTGLRVVEELRMGALEGADEYMFGMVSDVAVGRDGAMFVADPQVPVVRMYDAQGRFVRNVGRSGAGPGEYASLGGMRTLRDGRLAIWDSRNRRISLYDRNGEFQTSHPLASGLFSVGIFEVDSAGFLYVRTAIRRDRPEPGVAAPQGWIRVAPSGRVLDTIPIPSDPNRPPSFVLATPSGYDRPFVIDVLATISTRGYLITGRNDAYRLDLHRPGAPVLRIEREYSPVSLQREERAEWEAWARYFVHRAANPSSTNPNVLLPAPRIVSYTIPVVKPAYSELKTDSQGRIWVRRYVAAEARPGPAREPGDARPRRVWREPPTYDVLEADGRFLGTVTLPWDALLHDARDRHVWVTLRGELEESYVARLRIE